MIQREGEEREREVNPEKREASDHIELVGPLILLSLSASRLACRFRNRAALSATHLPLTCDASGFTCDGDTVSLLSVARSLGQMIIGVYRLLLQSYHPLPLHPLACPPAAGHYIYSLIRHTQSYMASESLCCARNNKDWGRRNPDKF